MGQRLRGRTQTHLSFPGHMHICVLSNGGTLWIVSSRNGTHAHARRAKQYRASANASALKMHERPFFKRMANVCVGERELCTKAGDYGSICVD